jgi:hypothetical protein
VKTTHKGYTIIANPSHQQSGKWTVVLSILNEDGEAVVAPLTLDHGVVFKSATLAERAGFMLAKYWIDGGEVETEATPRS